MGRTRRMVREVSMQNIYLCILWQLWDTKVQKLLTVASLSRQHSEDIEYRLGKWAAAAAAASASEASAAERRIWNKRAQLKRLMSTPFFKWTLHADHWLAFRADNPIEKLAKSAYRQLCPTGQFRACLIAEHKHSIRPRCRSLVSMSRVWISALPIG